MAKRFNMQSELAETDIWNMFGMLSAFRVDERRVAATSRLHSFRRKGGWLCWWGQRCNIASIESVVNAETAACILVEELQALQLVRSIVSWFFL